MPVSYSRVLGRYTIGVNSYCMLKTSLRGVCVCVCVCVYACACACVYACACACVSVCVCVCGNQLQKSPSVLYKLELPRTKESTATIALCTLFTLIEHACTGCAK